MTTKPTPAAPWVLNADGSVDVLVYQGRTWRAAITHRGLTNPAGYRARCGFTASYGGELIAGGDSDDGTITIAAVTPPAVGTLITVAIPDEDTQGFTMTKGKWDLVLEAPGGAEDPVCVGAFYVWREVTP